MSEGETNLKETVKIGVFVCNCGINIGGVVDVPEVVEYAKTLPMVAYAESNVYTCSSDGIKSIKKAIKEHDLNRVVVASCTPRTHEPLFRETCEEAGLNKYLFQMANIREHCSWVHMREPEEATEKTKHIVQMAVAKARFLKPQEESEVEVKPSSLIIGAGVSGMQASLCLANRGFKVFLIEKEPEVGGLLRKLYKLYPTDENASDFLDSIVGAVKAHENIKIFTSTTIKVVKGYIGNFEVTALKDGQQEIELNIGTIIVATGAEEFKPTGLLYGYGEHENVITQLELEQLLKKGRTEKTNTVVMIQCVGAMEDEGEREYCSRICCAVALKNSLFIKDLNPKAEVYIIYRDLQAYGKEHEKYYLDARMESVQFIKYVPERPPQVIPGLDGKLVVRIYDTLLDSEIEIDSDLVVLSTPLIQHEPGRLLSSVLKVPLGSDEFFLEAHVKLRPVDFAADGIYLCGTAHGPKTVDESIAQAYAAASRAFIPMTRGRVRSEAITATVDENLCRGCGECEEICEFNAIKVEEKILNVEPFVHAPMRIAKINEVLCKGCGSCAVACPTRAISMKHFTNQQILAEMRAAFGG